MPSHGACWYSPGGFAFVSPRQRGFTLVELMIVVAIVGILALLATIGITKYLAHAKTAEARISLGQIGVDESAAYERESMPASVLPSGTSAQSSRR